MFAGNQTLVGWVSTPNQRGTLDILVSCLTTLVLCVWSAIHLNISDENETNIDLFWRYVRWSLIGIFGPELVVWTAWRQLISARALQNQLKLPSHLPQLRQKSGSMMKSTASWSLTHGFYASMGGFVFDLNGPSMRLGASFVNQWSRLTLTAKGVALLAECGLLPTIDRDQIEDKNKSDSIGKTLACVQVTWLVVSVLARLTVNLPITTLEVNTLGHVLCALIVYALWWSKPRCVKQPTKLEGDWVRPMAAFMFLSSRASGQKKKGQIGIFRDFGVNAQVCELRYQPSRSDPNDATPGYFYRHSAEHESKKEPEEEDIARTTSAESLELLKLAAEAVHRFTPLRKRLHAPTNDDFRRHELALQAYPEMPERFQQRSKSYTASKAADKEDYLSEGAAHFSFVECLPEQLVTVGPNDWPSDDLIRSADGLLMGTVLWLATVAYAAVHIAAWNTKFPSMVEAWFWRGSSLYIAFAGVFWFCVHIAAQLSSRLWWLWYDLLSSQASGISRALIYTCCAFGGLSYVFARSYVVVEAFLGLRSMPAAVYAIPEWTISIPHV